LWQRPTLMGGTSAADTVNQLRSHGYMCTGQVQIRDEDRATLVSWTRLQKQTRLSPSIIPASVREAERRCHCGQPSLPIAVTSQIDGADGSLNDGITSHSGESGMRFGYQLITWSKSTWLVHKWRDRDVRPATKPQWGCFRWAFSTRSKAYAAAVRLRIAAVATITEGPGVNRCACRRN
jgi:hypothetical protein